MQRAYGSALGISPYKLKEHDPPAGDEHQKCHMEVYKR